MAEVLDIPVFPLHAVLFPQGSLPLRIFEPRYLEMVSDCMKRGSPFGVALIVEGSEVGEAATFHEVGCLAHIVDWDSGSDGLLNITCRGGQRLRTLSKRVTDRQLTIASVELLPPLEAVPVPDEHGSLVELLGELMVRVGRRYAELPRRLGDADWVGCRLAELLPLDLDQRQHSLEFNDPLARLRYLAGVLRLST